MVLYFSFFIHIYYIAGIVLFYAGIITKRGSEYEISFFYPEKYILYIKKIFIYTST